MMNRREILEKQGDIQGYKQFLQIRLIFKNFLGFRDWKHYALTLTQIKKIIYLYVPQMEFLKLANRV